MGTYLQRGTFRYKERISRENLDPGEVTYVIQEGVGNTMFPSRGAHSKSAFICSTADYDVENS